LDPRSASFDRGEVLDALRRAFAAARDAARARAPAPRAAPLRPCCSHAVERASVELSYPGVALSQPTHFISISSRSCWQLREQPARARRSRSATGWSSGSSVVLYAARSRDTAIDSTRRARVEDALAATVQRSTLRAQPVSADELEKARILLTSEHFERESVSGLAASAAAPRSAATRGRGALTLRGRCARRRPEDCGASPALAARHLTRAWLVPDASAARSTALRSARGCARRRARGPAMSAPGRALREPELVSYALPAAAPARRAAPQRA